MAGLKEIRNKIKSVQSTRKITKAMEMVSASKMKKAQDRMRASRPYVDARAADRDARRQGEHRVQAPVPRQARQREARRRDRRHDRQGSVRRPQHQRPAPRAEPAQGVARQGDRGRLLRDRQQGPGLPQRLGANIVSQVVQLGDRPHLDQLVGPVKVLLDKYIDGTIDEVHIFFTTFVNTMKQEPRHGEMLPIPEEFRAPGTARCARRTPPSGVVGLHLRARREGAARRRAAALCRGARVPDGQREHGVRAVGADGRDARGVRQRRRRSSTSCSSSTTRRGRPRSPRSWRRSSAARRRFSRRTIGETDVANVRETNRSDLEGTDEHEPRNHRPVHRRRRRRGVRADRDAEDLRRAQDGRDRADARSAAAARRRRRAHDRARQLRRPAPRHEGRQHRRADHGAGRAQDARPHHGRARPPDRRARPGRRRKADVDPPRRADVRGALAVDRSCSRPASRSSTSSARSPRAARSASSAAPASARPSR